MIQVEIWSDINCPFCYIGKRHLEMALDQFPHKDQVKLIWRSFELDPHTVPPKGADSTALLAQKYGRDLAWARSMQKSVTEMAQKSGLDFDLSSTIAANSFDAHRLLHLCQSVSPKLAHQMLEKLFSYKFCQGKDIADLETLIEAAEALGMDRHQVSAMLMSENFGHEVRSDEELAGALGITGVPYFVFNKHLVTSGARPPEHFLQALKECHEDLLAQS